ncbi:hypothetical protein ADS79_20370 [Brevibacillus reuszeri]|uniref:UDP-N-acetylmuramyl pentapeptide phosphotransferase n=1 Tax=Brevibacillus reuszeri TaxID=54915 RepID=A0A0K9YRA4_9BACL|nr:hypothetical protein ADS79_20370 [Brevibacillus reuszeri]
MVGGTKVETKWIIAYALSLGLPFFLHRAFLGSVQKRLHYMGMQRVNYRGNEVLTAGGVLIVASTTLTVGVVVLYLATSGTSTVSLNHGLLLVTGMITLAVWGWLDDCSKDESKKGFRGHFGALWREGKVTSGLWKAWGGGSTALLISLAIGQSFWTWLLAASLLTLAPNVLNLFDMRPARALKVFWLLLLIAGVAGYYSPSPASSIVDWVWLLPVITSSILLFRHDAGGKLMLGDTGANSLGFATGYAFVIHSSSYVQVTMLFIFITLHVMAEFISFSQFIDRLPWLKRMDSWGRSAESE